MQKLFSYVESFASSVCYFHGFEQRDVSFIVGDFRNEVFDEIFSPHMSRVEEVRSQKAFFQTFESFNNPVVIRDFAQSWDGLHKWNNLNYFIKNFGNRIVPIERGVMLEGQGMKESLMTIKDFFEEFMIPSSIQRIWPLSLFQDKHEKIAYLAQHELLNQIPSLLSDVEAPSIGGSSPKHINVWIGTGGTRTPLHFDSYDNLLVQIVGVKYIRLYHQRESKRLYVLQRSKIALHSKQGNMSQINCEKPDFLKHPLSKDAKFTETILYPGDCLYIPANHWHYVRSLTTSASVNYWF